MADAPPSGASLATIEAYQATIPKADFTNPQIAALFKAESEQALGGYYENIPIYAQVPSNGGRNGPGSVGPKLLVAAEAVWVSTASAMPPPDDNQPPLSAILGADGACISAGAAALAVAAAFGGPIDPVIGVLAFVGAGLTCASAILSESDSVASTAQDMLTFSAPDAGADWTSPVYQEANGPSATDQFMGVGNLLLPGGYGGTSESITIDSVTGNGAFSPALTYNDTSYTNGWGNNDPFSESYGGNAGFGFVGQCHTAQPPGSSLPADLSQLGASAFAADLTGFGANHPVYGGSQTLQISLSASPLSGAIGSLRGSLPAFPAGDVPVHVVSPW